MMTIMESKEVSIHDAKANEGVVLRAFEKSDISHLHVWVNDPESLVMIGRYPLSLDEIEQKVEKHRQAHDLMFVMEQMKSTPLGWVYLSKIEQEHGRAEIGILVAPEHRGKGIGKVGMSLMLNLAFQQLRLHRVYLTTRSINNQIY